MAAADSLTASIDNAGIDQGLLAATNALFAGNIANWQRAGAHEQFLFQSHNGLNGLADQVLAVAHQGKHSYWVLQNDWSGFPDPSEFVLAGFCGRQEVFALGYFDDRPAGWSRPKAGEIRADEEH